MDGLRQGKGGRAKSFCHQWVPKNSSSPCYGQASLQHGNTFLLCKSLERGAQDAEGRPIDWVRGKGDWKEWEKMGDQGRCQKGWSQVKRVKKEDGDRTCRCQPQPPCFSLVAPLRFYLLVLCVY